MRATIAVAALGVAAVVWRGGAPAPAPAAMLAQPPSAAVGPTPAAPPPPALPQTVTMPHAPDTSNATLDVEAAVREARQRGRDEQEIHRLRARQLPAAEVEALARMEAAETAWRLRVQALQAACAANLGCDDARASFTREELARTAAYAAPALRQ